MGLDAIRLMPGHLIRRAQQVMSALFSEEIGSADLTSVQYAALVVIMETPGIDASALSLRIAFDRATIGGVIERLENKRLIRREPSDTDKRIKRLYVTPAGETTIAALTPAVERAQLRLLNVLDEKDRTEFMRLLTRLVDAHSAGD